MTLKYNSLPRKTLAEPLTASATSFRLNNIKKWDGTNLTAADFGTEAYGVLRDAKGTVVEFFAFDPATIADADIDFEYRGLAYNGTNLTTEIAGNKLTWGKGTIVELGTHGPQIFQWLQELIEGIAISGSPDATLTQKGLVELATASEIDAGTATGSTGAVLAIAPDQFGASKWALDSVTTSGGASDEGKVAKLNASGLIPEGFISTGVVDVQESTSSGTWTKPTQGTIALVEIFGAGGGGGSGRRHTMGGAWGGGGGGGGGYSRHEFLLSSLSATETVTIGTGGAGGVARTGTADGEAGGAGGASTFGARMTALGGAGGAGGVTGGGGAGGVGGVGVTEDGGTGATATADTGATATSSSKFAPTGGGSGGAGTASVNRAGGAGGARVGYTLAGGIGATTTTPVGGGAGNSVASESVGGTGGGGGGGRYNVSAGAGGAGGVGAGGGGGGGGDAVNSGAGGVGGDGFCRVTVF